MAAADGLGPQLLSRDRVILWTSPHDRDYAEAPWVIADVQRPSQPFPTVGAQADDIRMLVSERHYRVVFADDGFLVLRED